MPPVRSATRDFFDLLGEVRQERGLSYTQLASRTGIDRATLQRWFTKRVTLPSWDELRPLVTALDGGREAEWLRRWRQATSAEREASGTPEPEAPTADTLPAPAAQDPPSRGRAGRTVLAFVAVALLLAAGVTVYRVVARGGTVAADPPPAAAPTPTDVFSSPAPLPRSDTAWSGDRAAHARFSAREKRFYLYDDRTDGRSAILFISAGGVRIGPVYNSTGRTGRLRKGRLIPPQPVEVDTLDTGRPLDFRVCAGERGKPLALVSCGAWTRVPAT